MRLTVFFAACIFLFSSSCFADWISETDIKYKNKSPKLYASVAKAKDLISEANGNSDMNQRAYELLISVTKTDSNFAPAYVQLGRLSTNIGMISAHVFDSQYLEYGEGYIRRALALAPNYDYALAMMGYIKLYQNKFEEAEQYYSKAINMGSKYPYLKPQLSYLELKRGNYNKALELALEGFEQNKLDPKAAAGTIVNIIDAYNKMPNDTFSEEDKWFSKRVELAPDVAWYWSAYANFRLYRKADYESAISYATKARSLMDHGVARYGLAGAYYTKWAKLKSIPGKELEAKDAFSKGYEIYPYDAQMINDFQRNTALRPIGLALEELAKKTPQQIPFQRSNATKIKEVVA